MTSTTEPVPFSVTDKTAIITGAGSGINLAFAQLLLSRKCNVVIGDLSLRPEAEKVVEEHSAKDSSKPRAVFVKTDVAVWDDLARLFEVAESEFGGADIVCPGAGIFEPHWSNFWLPPGNQASKDPVHGTEGLGHYATLDINITHPIRTTQLAISRWLNPRPDSKVGKRVVCISSIAGQTPAFPFPLYVASKHAINGFVRSLAQLDPMLGIRVNCVAPGIIKTPLWTDHPEKLKIMDGANDTWVEPEEVAEAMLRCCEDDEVIGGYVMEVGKGGTRHVDWKMDPGPQGTGVSVSKGATAGAEVFQWLSEPNWGVTK